MPGLCLDGVCESSCQCYLVVVFMHAQHKPTQIKKIYNSRMKKYAICMVSLIYMLSCLTAQEYVTYAGNAKKIS